MKDKISPATFIFIILTMALLVVSQVTVAQIFPEVNTPVTQKLKQKEENEKLAMQYYNSEEYEKAAAIYKELHEQEPSLLYYTYYLYCLLGQKNYPEAEKLLKSKLKNEPQSSRYHIDLGYIYQLEDKMDKADKEYQGVIDNVKANKGDILQAANSFLSRQLFDYTIQAYLRGRELMKGTDRFHPELARVYELTGDYSLMIGEYLDMLKDDPSKIEEVQGNLQNVLNRDSDEKITGILRESLLKRSQREPENLEYSEMLFWLSIQKKDFAFALIQAISLDKRLNDGGTIVFSLANLTLSNKDYDVASKAYRYILDKGMMNPYYTESLTGSLRAKFLKVTDRLEYGKNDLISLKEEYNKALDELGYTTRTIFLMRDLAHLEAFYINDLNRAVDLLDNAIGMPGAPEKTIAECKLELGDILLFKGQVWDASLLYSQVEKAFKNDPIGHQAKFRNAKLSFYIGEFEWSKAQLDVLKAATTKLIANDAMELSLLISDNMDYDSTYTGLTFYSKADLYFYRNIDSLALLTLDSISMLGLTHPLADEILYKKAEIYIKEHRFHLADSMLAKVVSNYPYDILADNALFKRAEIQEQIFKDKEKAMALYQQLMQDFTGSLFTTEARKRYRNLRGDLIQ